MKWCCVSILLLFAAQACNKPGSTNNNIGGKGGSATLTVTPEHHGDLLDTCTIYIKYNTQDAPVSGVYDDSAVCALVDTTPVATFTDLKQGNYYLFASGYHSLYVPPYVKGGKSCTISSNGITNVFVPTY